MEDSFLKPEDYWPIVREGLLLPEDFVRDYYKSIVKKYRQDNSSLFTELRNVLNEFIDTYSANPALSNEWVSVQFTNESKPGKAISVNKSNLEEHLKIIEGLANEEQLRKNEIVMNFISNLGNKLRKFSNQREQALFMYYNNEIVKPENTKLYQYFMEYSHKENRCGTTGNATKDRNKIKLLEKVIILLNGKQKEQAKEELKELLKHSEL